MFVANEPAMVIGDCLVVADMHIGLGKEAYEAGIAIPSQSERFAKKLNRLKKETKTKRLVVLGDMKHKVSGLSFHERREIEKFLSAADFEKTIIVKGNHDGHIEKAIPSRMKNRVSVKKSFAVGDYMLTHGHRKVKTGKKNIVIGHNHPKVKFVDDLGATYIEPVWVRGRLKNGKRLVIMPSFNELSGAMIVNDKRSSDKDHRTFMGPIAKDIIKESARIYLLDGTYLGHLKDL